MPDAASLGALLIMAATAYWILNGDALERLWAGVTTGRVMTIGGFLGGLMWGPVLIKAAVGVVGGLGVLAIGGSISLTPAQFTVAVLLIIGAVIWTREADDDD